MDVLVRMVEHHVWLTGELIERGGRLAAAELDKPIELSPTARQADVLRRELGCAEDSEHGEAGYVF